MPEALKMTIILLCFYALVLVWIMTSLTFKHKLSSKECIFTSIVLVVCASFTLVGTFKLKQVSDGYQVEQNKWYIDQINNKLDDIKYNQGIQLNFDINGVKIPDLNYEFGDLTRKYSKEDMLNLKHFNSWVFFIEVVCALISIPLAVNLFVYGVTSKGRVTNYYEILSTSPKLRQT